MEGMLSLECAFGTKNILITNKESPTIFIFFIPRVWTRSNPLHKENNLALLLVATPIPHAYFVSTCSSGLQSTPPTPAYLGFPFVAPSKNRWIPLVFLSSD